MPRAVVEEEETEFSFISDAESENPDAMFFCGLYRTNIDRVKCQEVCTVGAHATSVCQGCHSPWRVCLYCYYQENKRKNTDIVDWKEGLCEFHHKNGPEAHRLQPKPKTETSFRSKQKRRQSAISEKQIDKIVRQAEAATPSKLSEKETRQLRQQLEADESEAGREVESVSVEPAVGAQTKATNAKEERKEDMKDKPPRKTERDVIALLKQVIKLRQENPKMNDKEASRKAGQPKTFFQNLGCLLQLTPKLQKLVSQGELKLSLAQLISRQLPQEKQESFWQKVVDEDWSVVRARKEVKKFLSQRVGSPKGAKKKVKKAKKKARFSAAPGPKDTDLIPAIEAKLALIVKKAKLNTHHPFAFIAGVLQMLDQSLEVLTSLTVDQALELLNQINPEELQAIMSQMGSEEIQQTIGRLEVLKRLLYLTVPLEE